MLGLTEKQKGGLATVGTLIGVIIVAYYATGIFKNVEEGKLAKKQRKGYDVKDYQGQQVFKGINPPQIKGFALPDDPNSLQDNFVVIIKPDRDINGKSGGAQLNMKKTGNNKYSFTSWIDGVKQTIESDYELLKEHTVLRDKSFLKDHEQQTS